MTQTTMKIATPMRVAGLANQARQSFRRGRAVLLFWADLALTGKLLAVALITMRPDAPRTYPLNCNGESPARKLPDLPTG
jgi:hypothetical protein